MDQAETENQIISWHQQECCDDTDLDRTVCLSADRLSEIRIKIQTLNAVKLLWVIKAKNLRLTSRRFFCGSKILARA